MLNWGRGGAGGAANASGNGIAGDIYGSGGGGGGAGANAFSSGGGATEDRVPLKSSGAEIRVPMARRSKRRPRLRAPPDLFLTYAE
jgi:hypothetical protein